MRNPHVASRDSNEVCPRSDPDDLRWFERLWVETDEAGRKDLERTLIGCLDGESTGDPDCDEEQGASDESSNLARDRPGAAHRRTAARSGAQLVRFG